MIFTFGANEAGVHGAGAALAARLHHGAVLGQGVGRQGDSYAIPTKGKIRHGANWGIGRPLPVETIKAYVDDFVKYATEHPELEFQVTAIGTGHAGYTHEQMAPLFADCPANCSFDTDWKPFLGESRKYWGHVG
jgi:hypothetical protein